MSVVLLSGNSTMCAIRRLTFSEVLRQILRRQSAYGANHHYFCVVGVRGFDAAALTGGDSSHGWHAGSNEFAEAVDEDCQFLSRGRIGRQSRSVSIESHRCVPNLLHEGRWYGCPPADKSSR